MILYGFLLFLPLMQSHRKKRGATGEATGGPLWGPLGGHWGATVVNRTSLYLFEEWLQKCVVLTLDESLLLGHQLQRAPLVS